MAHDLHILPDQNGPDTRERSRQRSCACLQSDRYCQVSKLLSRNSIRAALVSSLLKAVGSLESHLEWIEVEPASERNIAVFHTREYLQALKKPSKLGMDDLEELGLVDDCPAFEGVLELASLEAGGSLQAAELLARGQYKTTIWFGGGRHHAMADSASGYCYVNDCNLAILHLLKTFERVMYIDMDVHHCDAVEDAFCMTDRVLTISFHHHADLFFPGTGGLDTMGERNRSHHAIVNVPLRAGCGDSTFMPLFSSVLQSAQTNFRPNVIILQCGADALSGDPVGVFNLTTESYIHAVETCKAMDAPLLILGGGGYNPPSVAKCWTIITHAAAGIPRDQWPEQVPGHEFVEEYCSDLLFMPAASRRKDYNDADYVNMLCSSALNSLVTLGRRLGNADCDSLMESEKSEKEEQGHDQHADNKDATMCHTVGVNGKLDVTECTSRDGQDDKLLPGTDTATGTTESQTSTSLAEHVSGPEHCSSEACRHTDDSGQMIPETIVSPSGSPDTSLTCGNVKPSCHPESISATCCRDASGDMNPATASFTESLNFPFVAADGGRSPCPDDKKRKRELSAETEVSCECD